MATLEEYAKKRDVRGMLLAAILTALSFVIGLFWNDAIRSGIETIIPIQERVSAKFMAALFVTIMGVLVAYTLIKTDEFREKAKIRLQKRLEQMEKRRKRKR